MKRLCGFLVVAFFATISAQNHKSIHQIENEFYSYKHLTEKKIIEQPTHSKVFISSPSIANKTIFGYLPYWEYFAGTHINLRYNLLSHIAIFSFEVDSTGVLKDPPGWPWNDVIITAHSNNAKVIMTVTNFNREHIHRLLTDNQIRQTLFQNILNVIDRYNLDGVNIDFEDLLDEDKQLSISQFMRSLKDYISIINKPLEVSFAAPAVGFGKWDFKSLADNCDYLFVMCYEFYGSWAATTGPSSPLTGQFLSVTKTFEEEYKDVPSEKLIMGVPYCGNHWKTKSGEAYTVVDNYDSLNTNNFDWQKHVLYRDVVPLLTLYQKMWDIPSQTPWIRQKENDTSWNQIWHDDSLSLDLKYNLAIQKNLKGVGIWALGYDGNREELWKLIEKKFANPTYVQKENQLPSSFILYQNYPNPFNPETVISYRLPVISKVTLKVFDVLGREIATLVNEEQQVGIHHYTFSILHSSLSSGVYFYQLKAGSHLATRKMVILR